MEKLDTGIKLSISAGILAASGAMFWWLQTKSVEYSDKQLLKTSHQLYKEFFLVFKEIADKSKKLSNSLISQGRDPDKMRSQIALRSFEQNKKATELMKNIEQRVLAQRKMNLEDYQYSFNERKSKVPELQRIETLIKDEIDLAGMGKINFENITLPESYTLDVFYEVLLDSRLNFSIQLIKLVELYFKNGDKVGVENEKFMKEVKELSPTEFKQREIIQRGYSKKVTDPHPLKVLAFSIAHFGKIDKRAKMIITTLNMNTQKLIMLILNEKEINFQAIEDLKRMANRQDKKMKRLIWDKNNLKQSQQLSDVQEANADEEASEASLKKMR